MEKIRNILLVLLLFSSSTSFSQLLDITEKIERNPAKLNAYIHFPNNKWQANLPVVLVLHGCSQTAKEIYTDAGWEKLSDSLGFIVLLPEQRVINNAARCFNWYNPSNQTETGEEIQSIFSIRDFAIQTYQANAAETFIYGVSAGAIMSVNCIFISPEKFKGAAILAGTSFGNATNYQQTFKSIVNTKIQADSTLIRTASEVSKTSKSFPKTIVFQGDKDKIVDPKHAMNLARQIALIRQLSPVDTLRIKEVNPKFPTQQVNYTNSLGEISLQTIFVHNWGHYLMVNPGTRSDQGGQTSSLSRDGDFWSTRYICVLWGF